jgi:CBS domain containing-hemolysin-like protein
MTPLVDVMALEESCTAAAVRQQWIENSHSRIPVYNDRVDNITGIMYVYDLLKVLPLISRRFALVRHGGLRLFRRQGLAGTVVTVLVVLLTLTRAPSQHSSG